MQPSLLGGAERRWEERGWSLNIEGLKPRTWIQNRPIMNGAGYSGNVYRSSHNVRDTGMDKLGKYTSNLNVTPGGEYTTKINQ